MDQNLKITIVMAHYNKKNQTINTLDEFKKKLCKQIY